MNSQDLVAALHDLHQVNLHMVPIAESWVDGVWTVDLAVQDREHGVDIDASAEDLSLGKARKKALARLRRSYTLAQRRA
jgi:hypothetical protein